MSSCQEEWRERTAVLRIPLMMLSALMSTLLILVSGALSAQTPPVAAYGFESGSGSTAVDSTGNGHDGTLSGASWVESGRFGGALSFDGTNDWVTVADATDLDLTTGMTLEAWVRPSVLGGWRTVILKERSNDLVYAIYADDETSRPAGYAQVGNTREVPGSGGALPLDAWTHLAFTYDGSVLRLYRDGVQIGSQSRSGSIGTSSAALRIGGNSVWGEYFSGLIDEVRIYNRALTATEIQADMAIPVVSGPPAPELVISAPAEGATIIGTTVDLAYTTVGDLTEVDRAHFVLDGGSPVPDATFDGLFQLTGIAPGLHTLDGYLVRGDGSKIVGSDATAVTFTTSIPDATPPVVNLIDPVGGAVLTSTVSLSASATDNVGVAGVQFRLNGSALGAEDTDAPYSYNWNTFTVANGDYVLTATARDLAGNSTESSPVSVTVSNEAPPQVGLVAAYGFESGDGSVAIDATGNGHDGTIAGASWVGTGRYGGALSFDGTGDLVTVTDAADLDLTTGMTLEAWVRPSVLGGWRTVILKERSNDLVYAIYADDETSRPAGYAQVGNTREVPGSGGALPLDAWTHLAFTYDGSVLRLYRDGVQIGSQSRSGSIGTSSAALRIGGNSVWGEYFSGLIDEVRIYNRALSPAEIQADMAIPVVSGPPAPELVISAPAEGSTIIGTTVDVVYAIAGDLTEVDQALFTIDGSSPFGDPTPGDDVFQLTDVPIGPHTLDGYLIRADGSKIAGSDATTVNFTTSISDTIPPVVNLTNPTAGAVDVELNTVVTATFDEALDPATVNGTTFTLVDGTTPVAAAVSYESATQTAVLTPSSPLASTTLYTATVTTGVTDAAGNALAAPVAWSFSTIASPTGICANPPNEIVAENCLPGSPASEWDISGAGDSSIQGFATEISVDQGQTVLFKVDTDSSDYRIDIYRLGYYEGLGARKVATIQPSAALPQNQPACLEDFSTGLIDCGNWVLSATWSVPTDAVSGVYLAKLEREDGGGSNHMVFIVRDDDGGSDLLFQTSDTTWQAYNRWGGNSLYFGSPAGRAYKVSYNRPFSTRDCCPEDWVFNAEYPMIRWLEANGYDVSYFTDVDSDRLGAEILEHEVFLSVGHDEYWSAAQRSNVEAARDAGVNLAFFSGNEIFWKTRWETSIDGLGQAYRTLVCYKDTHENTQIDPTGIWTGTWRDPRFSPPADGGRPENELTGTIFAVNGYVSDPIEVPSEDGKLRFWRNTTMATLGDGEVGILPSGTLGYEWDDSPDNGFQPPGLIKLSSTTLDVAGLLLDYGSTFGSGTATHSLTLYQHQSGALVFGAGTVQWSWGLDDEHDFPGTPADRDMQQATVNLFADMNVQPGNLDSLLISASPSSDVVPPISTVLSPPDGSTYSAGETVLISGTAADSGGGLVGGVEVSVDGGATWHPAVGREDWAFSFEAQAGGVLALRSRAVDDSGNLEVQAPDSTSPTVLVVSPSDGAIDVIPSSSMVATFSEPLNPTTVNGSTFEVRDDLGALVTGVVSYASATRSATFMPSIILAGSALYTATLRGGAGGVTDLAGNPLAEDFVWSFTTGTQQAFYSLWDTTTTPTVVTDPDFNAVELGVKFQADIDGFVYGVSFYKGPENVGVHVGSLWTSSGSLLASATFTNESASGWQTVQFETPVPVTANTTYVASYHAPQGGYSADSGYFVLSGWSRPPLRALVDGEEGGNGVYQYGPGGFPVDTWLSANYWVDVLFSIGIVSDTVPPTVTGVSPADQAVDVSAGTAVGATFDEAVDPASITPATFELLHPSTGSVSATLAVSPDGRSVTLVPDQPLAASTIYTAVLRGGPGGVTDLAGNALAADYPWSFTVAAADETPPAVVSVIPQPDAIDVPVNSQVVASFDEALDPATVNGTTFELRDGAGVMAAAVVYEASTQTAVFTPTALLAGTTVYTATIKGGETGVKDLAGNPLVSDFVWSFTTGTEFAFFTLWDDSTTPTVASAADPNSVELGLKFQTDVDGYVAGLRFYKGPNNGGTHFGSLWTAGGTLLANAIFTGETATGWQEVLFSTPVAIAAGTTYVVSYLAPQGGYAFDSGYFALTGWSRPPLRALVDGEEGGNAVYLYGSGGFPVNTWNSANYWVDVIFATVVEPDSDPPAVTSVSPPLDAVEVPVGSVVEANFDEAIDPASVTSATFELLHPVSGPVAASLEVSPYRTSAVLTPVQTLSGSTTYTAVLRGGTGGVTDLAGNPLASDFVWSFSTGLDPSDGPGGPILVVLPDQPSFGNYLAEILRAEGLNAFDVRRLSELDAPLLAAHDVVLLAEMTLSVGQAQLLSDWVDAGGNLIAMRPDPQLAGLLGLATTGATLSEGYLLIDTTSGSPGLGIVGETIQYHGTADVYSLIDAVAVATLYSDSVTPTTSPAVTLRNVGVNGGSAAAFAYDLARSVVHTRQGNPAWDGQDRDENAPVRPFDLFYGPATFDPQPDWVDFSKMHIPQADEQQRLLANLILTMNSDRMPLPRFWYFPRGEKAVVVMTGDDHATGGTAGRFDIELALSPVGCTVADWECVRSTSYIYVDTPLSNVEAASYEAAGFEIGIHVDTGCQADWSSSTLPIFYGGQIAQWQSKYTSLGAPRTHRTHCIAWSDYVTQPKVELDYGIRLDTNYYYWFWPLTGIDENPGLFTGSGMPMRFADLDGSLIDVYQATTQLTDESGQTYPETIDALLARALGPDGFYGAFTTNHHTDAVSKVEHSETVAAAVSQGVPVVSARQMLVWLDGRNNSAFEDLSFDGAILSFLLAPAAGANGLQIMLPTTWDSGSLSGVTLNGSALSFSVEIVKGVEYAIFDGLPGQYEVVY